MFIFYLFQESTLKLIDVEINVLFSQRECNLKPREEFNQHELQMTENKDAIDRSVEKETMTGAQVVGDEEIQKKSEVTNPSIKWLFPGACYIEIQPGPSKSDFDKKNSTDKDQAEKNVFPSSFECRPRNADQMEFLENFDFFLEAVWKEYKQNDDYKLLHHNLETIQIK